MLIGMRFSNLTIYYSEAYLKSVDVGSLSPEPDKGIKKQSPKAVIGTERRFRLANQRYKATKKVPHSYLTNLKDVLGRKGQRSSVFIPQTLTNPSNIGVAISIPKSSRFNNFLNTGPGPGDYNIAVNKSYSTLIFAKSNRRLKCK